MTRIMIVTALVAGLAGCYPATPMGVRTSADKASQAETKARWDAMNDETLNSRLSRREAAVELEQRDGKK